VLEDALAFLEMYPSLNVEDAVTLVRSARGYEDALWVADGDPELSWLRLISAVETAALRWSRGLGESAEETLASSWPELWAVFLRAGDVPPTLIDETAQLVRSGKRFREFLLAYLPQPPERRPVYGAIDWDDMPRHLRAIYSARSKALHAGTPLPVPMIDVPRALGEDDVPAECIGTALSSRGAVWLPKDAPMHLHVFAYIAGEALRNWWRSLKQPSA
jgi:hypothetical protein